MGMTKEASYVSSNCSPMPKSTAGQWAETCHSPQILPPASVHLMEMIFTSFHLENQWQNSYSNFSGNRRGEEMHLHIHSR